MIKKKWKDTHVLELKEWGMLKWSYYPMQSTDLIRSLSKCPWYFSQKSWFIGKDPDAGKDWGQEDRGSTEDEIFGWHHWLNGHEFEQTPGDGERQRSLVCCCPWGRKEVDMTERLNKISMFVQGCDIFYFTYFDKKTFPHIVS